MPVSRDQDFNVVRKAFSFTQPSHNHAYVDQAHILEHEDTEVQMLIRNPALTGPPANRGQQTMFLGYYTYRLVFFFQFSDYRTSSTNALI
jgi:hypothetical protein